MKELSIMIKPASSLCNMRCQYCFYADVSSLREVRSFGLMEKDTTEAILANIFADLDTGDRLTLAFQGGEPTLAGLSYFRDVTEQAARYAGKGIRIQYALQTNGLLLDEAWCAFLKEHDFLVGLSLDGPAAYHDACRVDSERNGTFQRVLNAKRILQRSGVSFNILTVLTNQLARHPQQFWRFMLEQDLRFVQFIPCLPPLEGTPSPFALTPQRYASFYADLFDLWFQSYQQGVYYSVKLFDDLVNLLAFGQCNACGLLGRCQRQIIVEADGSVYPCDFYTLDQFCAGNLKRDSLRKVYESPAMTAFLEREQEPQPLCTHCPYQGMCGGGCQRMRRSAFYAPTDTACGHRLFLDHSIERLQYLAAASRRAVGAASREPAHR